MHAVNIKLVQCIVRLNWHRITFNSTASPSWVHCRVQRLVSEIAKRRWTEIMCPVVFQLLACKSFTKQQLICHEVTSHAVASVSPEAFCDPWHTAARASCIYIGQAPNILRQKHETVSSPVGTPDRVDNPDGDIRWTEAMSHVSGESLTQSLRAMLVPDADGSGESSFFSVDAQYRLKKSPDDRSIGVSRHRSENRPKARWQKPGDSGKLECKH